VVFDHALISLFPKSGPLVEQTDTVVEGCDSSNKGKRKEIQRKYASDELLPRL